MVVSSEEVSRPEFTRVPIPSMVIRTSSPTASVKESGGTIPVPVSKMAPAGKRIFTKEIFNET